MKHKTTLETISWMVLGFIYVYLASRINMSHPGLKENAINYLLPVLHNRHVAIAVLVLIILIPLYVLTKLLIKLLVKLFSKKES